ncbi:MAG TPA: class A beta-lactamase, partial [Acidobacteriaceae bacterium]|nr:class A beta-lactamase [Acidobacteriaceae bacterium]
MMSRRKLLQAGFPAMAGLAMSRRYAMTAAHGSAEFAEKCKQLETASGGRMGVAMRNTATGVRRGYRENERFPMCSTSKLLTAGAVLTRVDQGKEQLSRVVHFSKSDLVSYSPATEKRVGQGMSIEELCAAAVTLSDNTAANLLLATIGGPPGFTRFARSLGDNVTRLDRNEPTLNQALPGDPRDTTSPAAIMTDMQTLVLGGQLSASSKAHLTQWLVANTTGEQRLRAGVPKNWKVGDKTGSGDHGTANDVGILWPPGHAPLLAAVYLTG